MVANTALQKKMVAIILSIALVFVGIYSIFSIEKLQGNARVINYTGVVRGATQKLIKEELRGVQDNELISRLDHIIEELVTGEGEFGLIRLDDEEFQSLMTQMEEKWTEIKAEILNVRQGADQDKLFSLSQDYFDLADKTVSRAELYTERNTRTAEMCYEVITVAFILVAGFLIWISSVQNKRLKALQKAETENQKKSEHLTKMANELQAPMNDISELIYVSDIETHDLLFVNEAGKKTFHLDDINGLKCYSALQGESAPCSFCTNALLEPGKNYNWERTNPVTKGHYLLKDRLIEWDGHKARLEIAFDVTKVEYEKLKLQYALDTENMAMECIRILYQGRSLENDISKVLEQMGAFLKAERTYIISIKDDMFYNDLEWCTEGVASQREMLQGIPTYKFERWISVFKKQECIVIDDIEDYKESSPGEYEILAVQGIRSLVVAPMEREGVLVGCLGVDNPSVDKLWNITSLLQSLCYFMLLASRRAEDEHQLSQLSFHDNLTSFYNRNRFMKDLESPVDNHDSVGIVYLDVNGLKEANDKFGHAYGDKLLVKAANSMKAVFGQYACYRVGGDEFVIICMGIVRDTFEKKVLELKKSFDEKSDCHAAIGAKWEETVQNINKVVAAADARMYEDKKEFYRKNTPMSQSRHSRDESTDV